MAQKSKQWGAIIVMIALFAMIAFVTNLCTPMATIIKNQGEISNALAQIGNIGNFIAYLVMGIPAGMLIAKYGYKKTALIGLVIGIVGILIQWCSGLIDAGDGSNIGVVFGVYLLGAFIAGLTMCILNCVVNPMLNLLGGGGNKGNQLIQVGGVFNSSAAVACYILMGALIADASKAKIADATPALWIALAIFAIAFVVILFTKIDEPEQAPVDFSLVKGALKFRHFALGALAIFLYMGVEVGTPNAVQQFLNEPDNPLHIPSATVGMIVAVYWFMMLIGRFTGAAIGSKVSSRAMVTTVATITLALVLFGMYAPMDVLVNFPGVDWGKLELIWQPIPIGIFAFLLVGLCTSVMWGAIFNMAVEGLGKYTAQASGIFMMMVVGGGVLPVVQSFFADFMGYMPSYFVYLLAMAYMFYYALIGCKNINKDIPVE